MKIKPHNYLGLIFNSDMQMNIYNMQKKTIDKHPIESERKYFEKEVYDLLVTEGNINYLMTAPSLEISKKIKIDEDKFDGTIYKGLKRGKKITILVNDKLFYRYMITERGILCIWVTIEPIMYEGRQEMYMRYTTFRIDTDNGFVNLPEKDKPENKELFKSFIQHLTFLEFSELETVTLKPTMKIGTKREGQYFNDSKENIVIVDSTWNKTVIRVGEFGVSGHLRLQPVGEGRANRKLIYIAEFTKSGYIRNAKKELTKQD